MMIQKIRKHLSNEKGFTLMELMVVIAVIGVLAAMTLPKFTSAVKSAQEAKAKSDIRTVMGALESYYADKGSYPTSTAAAKTALVEVYLKKWPKSYNDTDAAYIYNWTANEYEVRITPYRQYKSPSDNGYLSSKDL